MKGTIVEVCIDGSNCKQCGEPTQVTASKEWAVFTCGYESIRGNQVKVIQNDNYLAFCEVRISDRIIKNPGEQSQTTGNFREYLSSSERTLPTDTHREHRCVLNA